MHELRSAAESGGKPGNAKGFLINIDANRCVCLWGGWDACVCVCALPCIHAHVLLITISPFSGGPKIGLPRRGWDSDLFPGVYEAIEGMLAVCCCCNCE